MDERLIILGEGDFERRSPAEPTLLPYLAAVSPPSSLPWISHLARRFAGDAHSDHPMPALIEETIEAIVSRASDIDPETIDEIAKELPGLAARIELDSDMSAADSELLAYTSLLRNDADLAARSVDMADGHFQELVVRGIVAPLLGESASPLPEVLAELPYVEMSVLVNVVRGLNAGDQSALLERWLDSATGGRAVAGVVALAPVLDPSLRETAAESGITLLEETRRRLPLWFVAYAENSLMRMLTDAPSENINLLSSHQFADRLDPDYHPEPDDVTAFLSRMESEHMPMEAMLESSERGDADPGAGRGDDLFLNAAVDRIEDNRNFPAKYFLQGGTYRLAVNLATDERATGIRTGAPVPLDRSVDRDIAVSFTARWLDPTPPQPVHVAKDTEATDAAEITFTVPTDLERVRITVLIEEAVEGGYKFLQSAVMSGTAFDQEPAEGDISFDVERSISRPATLTAPDVSIVLEDESLTVYAGAEALHFDPPARIDTFRAKLGDRILELSESTDDQSFAEDLSKIAARGADLLRELKQGMRATSPETRNHLFEHDGTVQVISRNFDADVPIEFVYDGEMPDRRNPQLCANFFSALSEGKCQNCDGPASAMCAFSFWGIRRSIERSVIHPGDPRPEEPLRARADESLLPASLGPAILGTSDRVHDDSRADVLAALRDIGMRPDGPVPDWDDWKRGVENENHRLLVLLAHTEQYDDPEIEIEGDKLDIAWVDHYVNPSEREPGPLVLLTGCDTARPESLVAFASAFLHGGAAIAVGTLAEIDQAVSARVTTAIVKTLQDIVNTETREDRRSVGEVMRRIRGRLLAERDPTGFNLVAYGDAEWRFSMDDDQ